MNKITSHYCEPLYPKKLNIKLKTDRTISSIYLYYGDPHDYTKINPNHYQWNKKEILMTLVNSSFSNHYFEATIEPNNGRCKYYFKLDNQLYYGQKGYFTNDQKIKLYDTFYYPYIHSNELFKPVTWVQNQIWCQIFVDRFSNGNPNLNPLATQSWDDINISSKSFYGGDLRGIINQLDHLQALGFSGLYLTPLFKAPSNHKYDTIDYLEIDPHFGTKDDLRELVDECHHRGMKILLDAVFNHSGHLFEPFVDVKNNLDKSIYFDWFHIKNTQPLSYETFSSVKYMPKLNTKNLDVQNYLIHVLLYYLREFNIDGWRFDVANELDHQFIRNCHHAIKPEFPEAYLLAEIWHDPSPWIQHDQFDGNMEYEIGTTFIEWLNKEVSTSELITRLCDIDHRTPSDRYSSQFHLLDSHDTARLINQVKHDHEKALLALFFLTLQKGSICLFYGTNYLLEGENDPYCRVPYPQHPSSQQLKTQDQYLNIINFRKEFLHIIQNEQPTYAEKDNQLIIDYPSLHIVFNNDNNTLLVNHQLFVF